MSKTVSGGPAQDPEQARESGPELTGDVMLAAQDFSNEEEGYHKTSAPGRSR